MLVNQWSLTLHGPGGILSQFDSPEAQFVLGTDEAADVLAVAGAGIAAKHAWVWIAEGRMQVEDLAGGTLVNGHPIEGRVEAEYPASVQVGEVTLLVEVKAVVVETSVAVTIPQRTPTKSASNADVTIPQRAPTKAGLGNVNSQPISSSPTAKPDAPLTGGYTLVREIARGGMGQIYFGEDPQLERQVAVKVSSISEGGEDPRFSKEAKVLAHLAHPNIVPIYNIGVDAQSRPFYSMKLVKGRTLQAVHNALREGDAAAVKEYPRATLLTIFRKVCDAMAFAHAKGVLHRDLKPENIMVGEYGEVLVMDWGLAKVLGGNEVLGGAEDVAPGRSPAKDTGDYGMTLEGEVMGTPQYMSPEQAEGMVAELDVRSDIYSLGGILYGILTLRPPIDGTTLNEVLTKVKKGEISSMATKLGGKGTVKVATPTAMGGEVPEALQAVTLKAMARERTKRYASVEALAGDVEAYQNGFATSAENAGALRQLALFIKRNKAVSSLGALFLVSLLAFTVHLRAREREARRAAAASELIAAEGAESAGQIEQMQASLARIPEDLRSQNWEYLNRRVNSANQVIEAPNGSPWVTMVAIPQKAGVFYTLQQDRSVRVLDLNKGTAEILFQAGFKGAPSGMLLSGDGQRIAVAYGKSVKLLNVTDGQVIAEFEVDHAIGATTRVEGGNLKMCGSLNRDGSRLLVVTYSTGLGVKRDSSFSLWDVDMQKRLWKSTWKERCVAEFSSEDRIFLLTDQMCSEIDPNTGDEKAVLSKIAFPAYGPNSSATFVSDEKWEFIFAVGNDGVLRKTITKDGSVGATIKAWESGRGDFKTFQYLPKSKALITLVGSSQEGGLMQAWSADGDLRFSMPVFCGASPRLGVHPESEDICLIRGRCIFVWRDSPGPELLIKGGGMHGGARFPYSAYVSAQDKRVHFSRKGATLQMSVTDGAGALRAFDLPEAASSTFSPFIVKNPTGDRFAAIALGPDVVSTFRSDRGEVERGEVIKLDPAVVKRIPDTVQCPFEKHRCLSVDGQRLWMGSFVLPLEQGGASINVDREGLKFKRLGGTLARWTGSHGVVEIAVTKPPADTAEFEVSEKTVLVLWDPATGRRLKTVEAPMAWSVECSPDGKWIAEGSSDKRIRIRDAKTLQVVRELRAHDAPVDALRWHPRLPLLVSAGADQWIRIWNAQTGALQQEIRRLDLLPVSLDVSADGLHLGVGTKRGLTEVFSPAAFRSP